MSMSQEEIKMNESVEIRTVGEALTVLNPLPRIPLLAHIPHSSFNIPADLTNSFCVNQSHLQREQQALVDWFTDELFDFIPELGGTNLVYQVSRFVCDPERFEDDNSELMSERGMGALYTHGVCHKRIRKDFSLQERENLLNRFYRPHHQAFTELVSSCINQFGKCLILDCHSYPEKALPYEMYADGPRPEICIGADKDHSSEYLLNFIRQSASEHGYECSFNSPFKGSIVPLQFLGDSRIQSLMFEIRRDMYMDESKTAKNEGFLKLKNWLEQVSKELVQEFL